jgi:hypothetical protein
LGLLFFSLPTQYNSGALPYGLAEVGISGLFFFGSFLLEEQKK